MSTVEEASSQATKKSVDSPVRRMRGYNHRNFFIGLGIAFALSGASGLAYFYLVGKPRFLKYKAYLENHDAMQRWLEICEADPTIMHTCSLAKEFAKRS
uniref:COX6C domain-containing protein n=1 Tax=Syphacia muris TaxID=451379 RepID=A0A0N5ANY8_9BILA